MTDETKTLSSERPKVVVGRFESGNALKVVVSAATSEEAVVGATTIAGFRPFNGTNWTSASVTTGLRSGPLLEIEGEKGGQVIVILIKGGINAGFSGTGVRAVAKILSRLFGFGSYDALLKTLSQPSRSNDPSKWHLSPDQ